MPSFTQHKYTCMIYNENNWDQATISVIASISTYMLSGSILRGESKKGLSASTYKHLDLFRSHPSNYSEK